VKVPKKRTKQRLARKDVDAGKVFFITIFLAQNQISKVLFEQNKRQMTQKSLLIFT
jgi:hypothetical protein